MKPEDSGAKGRFVDETRVRPAIKLEMVWCDDRPGEHWTTGRVISRSHVRPAIQLDLSHTPDLPTLSLDFKLHPEMSGSADQSALDLSNVVDAVNRIDRALGGAGMSQVADERFDGAVTLVLAPQEPIGAGQRIQQICARINQSPARDDLSLPAVVKAIRARAS